VPFVTGPVGCGSVGGMRHAILASILVCAVTATMSRTSPGKRPWVTMRGIYGGVPVELMQGGKTLRDSGVNAIFVGSGSLTPERVRTLHDSGARVFAEFNSMHHAEYLKAHPDAAPVGADGRVSPPPDGWQGLCPTHAGYRENRMNAFRAVLADCAVDGVWLDYHHSHASWEQAVPVLPDTCFCERCLALFQEQTGLKLPKKPAVELSRLLLGDYRQRWIRWRCDVFTDWVREYRAILDRTRPGALLGTFHCPWSDTDLGGALESSLAIDLKAQAQYIDVFSPMPYHARFGHLSDPGWISRQASWLGNYLGVRGEPGERLKIWPIVQASDWGEAVAASQIEAVLDHGTRLPATGVMVFAWGALREQPAKIEEIVRFYRAISMRTKTGSLRPRGGSAPPARTRCAPPAQRAHLGTSTPPVFGAVTSVPLRLFAVGVEQLDHDPQGILAVVIDVGTVV
jgi:hypothetical protein